MKAVIPCQSGGKFGGGWWWGWGLCFRWRSSLKVAVNKGVSSRITPSTRLCCSYNVPLRQLSLPETIEWTSLITSGLILFPSSLPNPFSLLPSLCMRMLDCVHILSLCHQHTHIIILSISVRAARFTEEKAVQLRKTLSGQPRERMSLPYFVVTIDDINDPDMLCILHWADAATCWMSSPRRQRLTFTLHRQPRFHRAHTYTQVYSLP